MLASQLTEKAEKYKAKVPVIINGDMEQPFLYLSLSGEVEKPVVVFEPNSVVLTPVPLRIPSAAHFNISISGYRK